MAQGYINSRISHRLSAGWPGPDNIATASCWACANRSGSKLVGMWHIVSRAMAATSLCNLLVHGDSDYIERCAAASKHLLLSQVSAHAQTARVIHHPASPIKHTTHPVPAAADHSSNKWCIHSYNLCLTPWEPSPANLIEHCITLFVWPD